MDMHSFQPIASYDEHLFDNFHIIEVVTLVEYSKNFKIKFTILKKTIAMNTILFLDPKQFSLL